ncbi:hypothetical protein [Coxiella-like endosymbiont]
MVVAPYKGSQEIKDFEYAGAYKIVTEGRKSGTVGVSAPLKKFRKN